MTQLATPTRQDNDAANKERQVAVKCVGLTKTFRDFWYRNRVKAVDQIDLEIRQGEVFGLLGPNGSGKSTTIKMILGLLHPTSGRIAVFGEHPRNVKVKNRIGYLPEESYLYPFLNARETLEYYGRLFHQNRTQRNRRIDMLLEMVGLDRVARRPVGEYSKGMQRRIGLAQALINDPQLLILDEPTTGLDPIGTAEVKRLIQTLAQRGKTILLCSHLLSEVEDVCGRVSIMYGGKIRREGTVDSLLQMQEMTTLQTETLDDQTLEEIERVLERHGKHIEKVDRPRQKLESLFLQIVDQARSEGLATSGAGAGGEVAAFLRTGEDDRQPEDDGQAVLDALVSGKHSPTPTEPAAASEVEISTDQNVSSQEAEQLPEDLVKPISSSQTSAPTSQPAADDSESPEDEQVDENLLDQLTQRNKDRQQ